MHEKMPEVYRFESGKPGPAFLIFGAVHGNEVCGALALKRLVGELNDGSIVLERGTLACVPVCNPAAYEKDVRLTEDNLNRVFKKWDDPDTYEKRLANFLTAEVEKCDCFLDIHSMTAKSDPAVFIDFPTEENKKFAAVLGARYGILGWPELYADAEQDTGIASFDTVAYAASLGKTAIIMECGQHRDPKAPEIAHQAVLNALRHFEMISGEVSAQLLTNVRMRQIYVRRSENDDFPRAWNHLDAFRKGDTLASTEEGPIVAEFDGVMLLPKRNAELGAEWFYTGSFE